MPSLTDSMKCKVNQIKELQEKLETMESEYNTAISTPMVTPVSNPIPTLNTSGNWRDTYDPYSSNTLNPHIPGATTANLAGSTA